MTIRLREWREQRGYSLRELARRAGVSFSSLYRIESGAMSPTVAMCGRLANELGIHITDLFPPKRRKGARRYEH